MTQGATLPDFVRSDHVSARTRDIFRQRVAPVDAPRHLSGHAFEILRVVSDTLLPQDAILGDRSIDLAALMDRALGGARDGWRYAALPSDVHAWEAGLLTLNDLAVRQHGGAFETLSLDRREALLDAATQGTIGLDQPERLDISQMKLWLADLRADTVSCFLSHPVVHQALGISATMTGGDERFQGFSEVGPDSREVFEPTEELARELVGEKT